MQKPNITYANASLSAKFAVFDWRLMIAFIIVILDLFSWWTWGLAFALLILLIMIQRRGYTFPNLFRRINVLLFGSYRPSIAGRRRRRII